MEEHNIKINFGTAFTLGAGLALGSLVVFIIPYIIMFALISASAL